MLVEDVFAITCQPNGRILRQTDKHKRTGAKSLIMRCGAAAGTALLLAACGSSSPEARTSSGTDKPAPTTSASRSSTGSPSGSAKGPAQRPNTSDRRLMASFIDFALAPSNETATKVPFEVGGVWLGLGDELIARVAAEDLAVPDAWMLQRESFRAYVGPFSALPMIDSHVTGTGNDSVLRRNGKLTVSVGEHAHCASPPVPAPKQVIALRRVSVQPSQDSITSCIGWFTVDLFVNPTGRIQAVTLDIWEP